MHEEYTRIQLVKELKKAFYFFPFISRIKSLGRPIVSPMHKLIAAIPEKKRILDIGCGTGALLHLALKYRKARYAYGYDISEKVVDYSLNKLWTKKRCLIEYNKELPELKGFDVVTMTDVIHHIPISHQNIFLKSVADKLDYNGLFIIMDIDPSNLIGCYANYLHDLIISNQWVHHRKPADIIALLTDYGLKVLNVNITRSLWYYHYLIVAKKY